MKRFWFKKPFKSRRRSEGWSWRTGVGEAACAGACALAGVGCSGAWRAAWGSSGWGAAPGWSWPPRRSGVWNTCRTSPFRPVLLVNADRTASRVRKPHLGILGSLLHPWRLLTKDNRWESDDQRGGLSKARTAHGEKGRRRKAGAGRGFNKGYKRRHAAKVTPGEVWTSVTRAREDASVTKRQV